MRCVVTLYGRPGCHLCEVARERIAVLARELGELELREVNIERDEELLRRYLERIPIVSVNGRIVSELWLDEDALRSAVVDTLGA